MNKIDRGGAQYERVLQAHLGEADAGRRRDGIDPRPRHVASRVHALRRGRRRVSRPCLADLLAEHDDALLAAYVDDETDDLATASSGRSSRPRPRRGLVHPVFFGSAITGAGVDALTAGDRGAASRDRRRRPAARSRARSSRSNGVRPGRRSPTCGCSRERCGCAIGCAFGAGTTSRRSPRSASSTAARPSAGGSVAAGRSASSGASARSGSATRSATHGPRPAASLLRPADAGDGRRSPPRRPTQGALRVALAQLAEQDPLINLRQDDVRQEISISLYGEVQKEVIQETLATDFGVDVGFRETTTICIERPIGTGAAVEIDARGAESVPGDGRARDRARPRSAPACEFRLEVECSGPCRLRSSRRSRRPCTGRCARASTAGRSTDCIGHDDAFRLRAAAEPRPRSASTRRCRARRGLPNLTPLVLMSALEQAGTAVYEPIHRFRLEIPADTFGPALPALARLQRRSAVTRDAWRVLRRSKARSPRLGSTSCSSSCRRLTRGEGVLECAFDHYAAGQRRGPDPAAVRTTTRSTAGSTCCTSCGASRGAGARGRSGSRSRHRDREPDRPRVRYRLDSRSLNCAPAGSVTVARRPYGVSVASITTEPPKASTFATTASASSTSQ